MKLELEVSIWKRKRIYNLSVLCRYFFCSVGVWRVVLWALEILEARNVQKQSSWNRLRFFYFFYKFKRECFSEEKIWKWWKFSKCRTQIGEFFCRDCTKIKGYRNCENFTFLVYWRQMLCARCDSRMVEPSFPRLLGNGENGFDMKKAAMNFYDEHLMKRWGISRNIHIF